MANPKENTASFIVRFSQKIFEDEGESNIQWRGNVSHIQGGEKLNFTDFNDAMIFIQAKLKDLTINATQDKTPEERDGLLEKSLDVWKKVTQHGPKFLADTIKDPKKQVQQIQGQIQGQISQLGDEISEKVEIDQWRSASRSDLKKMTEAIEKLSEEVTRLNKKVDEINK